MIETQQRLQRHRLLAILCIALLLVAVCLASLALGARPIPISEVILALTSPDMTKPEHIVVDTLRIPRLYAGLFTGSALAVSGLIFQTVLRNGLADPGVIGINAGASFSVVIAIWVFGLSTSTQLGTAALVGAGLATLLVILIGQLGRSHNNPTRLILIGAALSAILGAMTSTVLFLSDESLNVFRFWMVGSLSSGSGAQSAHVLSLLPIYSIAMLFALAALRGLNTLQLGDDLAKSLGFSPTLIRTFALIAAALLAGTATAATGPIGFLGLVIPHLAQALVGISITHMFVCSLLLGPLVLITADVIGRLILPQGEVEAGIVMAMLGGIGFVLVVRKMKVITA
ncbi:iron ABC transporter permease [Leucothrix sargassi]|nr:iron ABC transporter permease [Leucothrix sargassi]